MTVRVRGLDEFRRELRKVDKRFGKAFGEANKRVGEKVVTKARPLVQGLPSPGGSKAMSGIKASAKQHRAVIRLLGSNPTIRANVFGMGVHYGGQPPRQYPGPGPWKPWIGTHWQPEDLHGVGPAIKDVADGFALDEYMDAVMDALKHAFPD